MVMILQKFTGYFFYAQILAIIGQVIQSKYPLFSHDRFNVVILFGYLLGFPLVITLYIKAYVD
jgi:hypothetical protein